MAKKLIRKVWIAVSAAALWGCGGRLSRQRDGVMLGTTLHITADVQGVSPQELYAAVMELDREAKASMSIFDPGSLLSRLNRGESDSVDRHIAFNLHLADSIGALSGGRYDVTVKPLVEAWGFAGRQAERHPDVDSILAFVGREKVRVRGRQAREGRSPRTARLQFDRQGYTVDLLARLVESFGARITSSTSAAKSAAKVSAAKAGLADRHRNSLRRQHVRRRLYLRTYPHERRRPGHFGQLPPLLP